MLQKWFSYCHYVWRSKNHHGVHSPFVYSFLTASVYSQANKGLSKKQRIINAIANHFSIETYTRLGAPKTKFLHQKNNKSSLKIKLVHIENPVMATSVNSEINQVFLIENIHNNTACENAWKTLINNLPNAVSLDFFDFGIVFVKDNQAKQHFILRA